MVMTQYSCLARVPAVVIAALLGVAGCGQPTSTLGAGTPMGNHPIARARMYDDIYEVVKFFPAMPWLSFDPEGDPDPEGFKVAVYLISSVTRKGEFADGVIHVRMWDTQTPLSGSKESQLIKEWTFTPEEALPVRVVKRTLLGNGYQLRLNWGDLDMLGRPIRVRIDYERKDGRMVLGQPHELRVPRKRTPSGQAPTASGSHNNLQLLPQERSSG